MVETVDVVQLQESSGSGWPIVKLRGNTVFEILYLPPRASTAIEHLVTAIQFQNSTVSSGSWLLKEDLWLQSGTAIT
jgi:hypothetical protein